MRISFLFSSPRPLLMLLALISLSMLSLAATAQTDGSISAEDEPSPIYLGTGMVFSFMDPRLDGGVYSVEDGGDIGVHLFAGMDLNRFFSVELNLSDLGSASLRPSGEVDFQTIAINGLYYIYKANVTDRLGLTGYVTAGLGQVDSSANIPYSGDNSTRIVLGMGYEYAWRNGYALRLAVQNFGGDASLFSVGMVYRFASVMPAVVVPVIVRTVVDTDGDGVQDEQDQCPDTPSGRIVNEQGCELDSDNDGVLDGVDQCPSTAAGVIVDSLGCNQDNDSDGVLNESDACPGTALTAVVDEKGCELDSDNDGVVDRRDQCPSTRAGLRVDRFGCVGDSDGDGVKDDIDECLDTIKGADVNEKGCAIFEAKIEGINFKLASVDLTASAKSKLDAAVAALLKFPSIRVEVQAHTDSQGELDNNQRLSDRRADSVVQYLESEGVARDRMVSRGYGETSPIAENLTPEGRALNRRVEFRVLLADESITEVVALPAGADGDGDGVDDSEDQCPATIFGADVNEQGCALFEGRVEGINFKLASSDPTNASKKRLDEVVKSLLKFPSVRIEIQAHTDSQGEIENNQALSEVRANSVLMYMQYNGVSSDRMEARGYGESRPLVSNRTVEGRAKNRRVEFRVLAQ